jgi:hypothetical protein
MPDANNNHISNIFIAVNTEGAHQTGNRSESHEAVRGASRTGGDLNFTGYVAKHLGTERHTT